MAVQRNEKCEPPRRQGAKHTILLGASAPWRFAFFFLLMVSQSSAAWFDAAWPYRRPIDVTWDAEHSSGNELCTADFYSDGHALPGLDDVRVATEDGKLVASHILINGPGDRIRLVFSLQKGLKKYAVYFGNEKPAPIPEGFELKFHAGLMIETKVWTGGRVNDFQSIEESWNRSGPSLGQAMIPNAYLGYNIFGNEQQWISKVVGSLFVPMDGEYLFAISVDDDAALYLDGQPLLFAPIGPPDIRYHALKTLTRGPHDFLLYHVNTSGDGRFTVGWKRPTAGQVEVIGRESFGTCFGSQVRAMEERGNSLVADFLVSNVGECFFADRYSLRYHFVSNAKAVSAEKCEWDFGDGQTATDPELDHVYLMDGIFPVKLSVHVGENARSETSRIVVSRNYEQLLTPDEDDPKVLSRIVQKYNLAALPPTSLARAVMLHLKAGRLDEALVAGNELARQKNTVDPGGAADCLLAVDRELINTNRAELAAAMWDHVSPDSDMQPRAAKRAAQLAMWFIGDFEKAAKELELFKTSPDQAARRLYGQAMILNSNGDIGKKILVGLPAEGAEDRQAVLSGAFARSVEFFIRTGDAEAGEEAWERWQARYPADFLDGYSVLLRTRLIELRKKPQTAANVAEAFARSFPQSSYAPQLLDRASKLLASSDLAKSKELRELLKRQYPEDPLSQ